MSAAATAHSVPTITTLNSSVVKSALRISSSENVLRTSESSVANSDEVGDEVGADGGWTLSVTHPKEAQES